MALPDEVLEAMAKAMDAAFSDALIRGVQFVQSPRKTGERFDGIDRKELIRAALSALSSAGYALVPRVATEILPAVENGSTLFVTGPDNGDVAIYDRVDGEWVRACRHAQRR